MRIERLLDMRQVNPGNHDLLRFLDYPTHRDTARHHEQIEHSHEGILRKGRLRAVLHSNISFRKPKRLYDGSLLTVSNHTHSTRLILVGQLSQTMTEEDALIVKQSADSNSRYTCEVLGIDVDLVFVSSQRGKMDFTISLGGKPKGKYNLLSQDSLKRLGKRSEEVEDVDGFVDVMLQVGVKLRDGDVVIPTPAEKQGVSYEGKSSSLGPINTTTVLEWLRKPDLLDAVSDVLHHSRPIPFVGDDAGLMTCFLVMLSCKTQTPLNLELIGQSSSGKTHMTLTARNGFPPNMIQVLAGASREALKYDYDEVDSEGNYLIHVGGKCMVILEKDESESFVRRLKPLMSGDDAELVWKTPIKNDLTGEIETREFRIIGQPSFITLTTRNPKEWEQVTRQFLMTPDTTEGKVAAVVDGILTAKARPENLQVHQDLDLMQASMDALEHVRVRNIWAPLLASFFPASAPGHQRNVTKVMTLVDAITLLHQAQRATETLDGIVYTLASVEDNIIALTLADKVMRASLSGVPDDSWMVFTHAVAMSEGGKALTEDNLLKYLHVNAFQTTRRALREKHLGTLVEIGLLEVATRGGGRGGQRKTYRVVRTQEALMREQALTPLFVESVQTHIMQVLDEFSDVLDRAEPAKRTPKPTNEAKTTLKRLGVASGREARLLTNLVMPFYTVPDKKENTLWHMIPNDDVRKSLYVKKCPWLPGSRKTGKATEKHTKHKETQRMLREVVDREVVSSDDWERLALTWEEGMVEMTAPPTEPNKTTKRRRRKRVVKGGESP